jgi:hypothetical protein
MSDLATDMSEFVTVYHGTSYARAESIERDGILPRHGGAAVALEENLAWYFACGRTADEMIHNRGRNLGLLVTAQVPAERLTKISPEPGGHRFADDGTGYLVAGGVRPDEISEWAWREFDRLKSRRGVWEMYRKRVCFKPNDPSWGVRDWKTHLLRRSVMKMLGVGEANYDRFGKPR